MKDKYITRNKAKHVGPNITNLGNRENLILPCRAVRAVAAHAGFSKSTKQRTTGSPFLCIKTL